MDNELLKQLLDEKIGEAQAITDNIHRMIDDLRANYIGALQTIRDAVDKEPEEDDFEKLVEHADKVNAASDAFLRMIGAK